MLRKRDWNEMRGEVTSAFGCATAGLICIAIDCGLVAIIAWIIRTIAG